MGIRHKALTIYSLIYVPQVFMVCLLCAVSHARERDYRTHLALVFLGLTQCLGLQMLNKYTNCVIVLIVMDTVKEKSRNQYRL